jgi:tRNA-dihydrouridine synthase B
MALSLPGYPKLSPFVLAPMAGITNSAFRLLMKEMGAGIVVSELISATGIQYASKKTLELCHTFEEERPVGLQIFGENAEHLSEAALFLQARGVDFVDINLGCPVPKVVSKGAGSAMLKDPRALYETLRRVRQSINVPLTIKIRTGWDSCSINASECVAAGAEAGVAWVAIHGRTRAQGYEGQADWELIRDVKRSAKIPVIGNGDILTAQQAITRLEESGCDGVMIGRGALRNPFIFSEIAQLRGEPIQRQHDTYWDLVNRHLELLAQTCSPFYAGIQMRKFMTWYSAGIEGASAFRKKLYEVPTQTTGQESVDALSSVMKLGQEFFARPGVQKQSSFLKEPFLQGGHG